MCLSSLRFNFIQFSSRLILYHFGFIIILGWYHIEHRLQ